MTLESEIGRKAMDNELFSSNYTFTFSQIKAIRCFQRSLANVHKVICRLTIEQKHRNRTASWLWNIQQLTIINTRLQLF